MKTGNTNVICRASAVSLTLEFTMMQESGSAPKSPS